METIIAWLLLPAVYIAAVGWGRIVQRLVYKTRVTESAYAASVGILAWIVIGAPLSHFGLATPWAFDGLIAGGVVLAVFDWKLRNQPIRLPSPSFEWLPPAIAIGVAGFFAWTLLPSNAFNYHDDFYVYLPRVVRMLQTGTLGGDRFDLMGLDGLGSQAFLQGLFLAHLPFRYVNAFDAVFCLLLAGLLVDAIGRRAQAHWALRSLAVATVVVLNAQYVNIAALYSGIAMIVGLAIATELFARSLADGDDGTWRAAVPVGLFVAAIASLKVTLIPFAAGFAVLVAVLVLIHPLGRIRALKPMLAAGGSAAALYGLWASLSSDKLIELAEMALQRTGSSISNIDASVTTGDTPAADAPSYLQQVLQKQELFYGGNFHDYAGMLIAITLLGGLATVLLFRRGMAFPALLSASALGGGAIISAVGILLGVYGIHVDGLVRYNAPVLIAVLPSVVLLGLAAARSLLANVPRVRLTVVAAGFSALLATAVGAQAGVFLDRASLAMRDHHILSFPVSAHMLQRLQVAMSNATAEATREMQANAPPGATILSWTGLPFLFDFSRNTIYTLWSPQRLHGIEKVEPGFEYVWLRQQLRAANVDYVIWLYNGRKPNWGREYRPSLDRALDELARRYPVVFADPYIVMFSTHAE